jgi:hypothetical protein
MASPVISPEPATVTITVPAPLVAEALRVATRSARAAGVCIERWAPISAAPIGRGVASAMVFEPAVLIERGATVSAAETLSGTVCPPLTTFVLLASYEITVTRSRHEDPIVTAADHST